MSIQPGNKAVENLINSTPVLGRKKKWKKKKTKKKKRRKTNTVNAFLIKNGKGQWGGVKKGGLSQTVGMIGRSSVGV